MFIKGDYSLDYYNCEASATLTGTFRLELYKDNFTLWAYALVQDERYSLLIDSGNAVNNMKVIAKDETTVLREIDFEAPLQQVINHYHHHMERFRRDVMYFLLANNKILKIKKTDLEDSKLSSFNLTTNVVYEGAHSKVVAFDAKLGKISLIDNDNNLIIVNDDN